ncbi:tRNA-(ms[2]io[6]A)-hydroxylase [Legionella sp.]|uniref:tRNA-(ms[2]io[6]A)-hydroxylase n=1 Tax=Legionella sp. TaxID=459 RepID=UPI003C988743
MLKQLDTDLHPLNKFLQVKTPQRWLNHAVTQLPLLLIDHAHCERKAAATAINFISKYPEKKELVDVMSPLAREELLHFEKVIRMMSKRGIEYRPLHPSGYAAQLHKLVTRQDGIARLCDQLIIGAIIEARSCERFQAIIPYLEDIELAKFYSSLVKSEARHFEDYLYLAKLYGGDVSKRIAQLLAIENKFILAIDTAFRFHSGVPETLMSDMVELSSPTKIN